MTDLQETRDQLFDQVLEEGVVTHWVDGHPDSTLHRGVPWAYTVGRTLNGKPELLVTGLDRDTSKALFDELGDQDLHPDQSVTTSVVGRVAFIRAETGLLFGAYALFGINVVALQAIWSIDNAGTWHDQPLHPIGSMVLTDPYPED